MGLWRMDMLRGFGLLVGMGGLRCCLGEWCSKIMSSHERDDGFWVGLEGSGCVLNRAGIERENPVVW